MTEASPSVQPLGLFQRMIGVIVSPGATFRHVVAAPRPVGVLFVVALLVSLAVMAPQILNEDVIRSNVQTQVDMMQRVGQPVTPAGQEAMVIQARRWVWLTPLNFLIFMPLGALFFAALFWAIFNATLGGTATFKQVLAIVTHGEVVSALGALAAAPFWYTQGQMTMAGPFTLRAAAPFLPDNSVWAWLLGTLSVFTVWWYVLVGIGLGVLYKRSAVNIAMGLLLARILIAAAILSAFGRFFGMDR
jgi:hypothetical protein